MDKEQLIALLKGRFQDNFAQDMAALVLDADCVETLYELATDSTPIPDKFRNAVLFRAAYVIDYIYFNHRDHFGATLRKRFMEDFSRTTNESAKRHFTKMISDILLNEEPRNELCYKIAEAAAMWATEPTSRVAVQIGAVNVLMRLRTKVSWIGEILPEILEAMRVDPTPAIKVNLRRWRALS